MKNPKRYALLMVQNATITVKSNQQNKGKGVATTPNVTLVGLQGHCREP